VFLDLPIGQNVSALDLGKLTGSLGMLDRKAETARPST
jgi:ribose transport system ATP-binding protein